MVDAFGFDLTPVYARRGDWAVMLLEQKQLREVRKRAFDEVTICRRATEEALKALAEHFPDIDRSVLEARLTTLQAGTPNRSQMTLPANLGSGTRSAPKNTLTQYVARTWTCKPAERAFSLAEASFHLGV